MKTAPLMLNIAQANDRTQNIATKLKDKNLSQKLNATKNNNQTTPLEEFNNFEKWVNKHDAITTKALELLSTSPKEDEGLIYEAFFDAQDKLGVEYDVMHGENPKDTKLYENKLYKLGSGQVEKYDKNGDNKLSLAEFLSSEISKEEMKDEEFGKEAISEAYTLYVLMDKNMKNSNNDNYIDASEFASFYKNLDQVEYNIDNDKYELTGNFDGQINVDSLMGLMEAVYGGPEEVNSHMQELASTDFIHDIQKIMTGEK